ncbi:hypothetical protein HZA97_07455 [Candidatus Woesearchaeota archaeon]|nr:hypothetical protein [Candidatus Woesearchaeota archaeon]
MQLHKGLARIPRPLGRGGGHFDMTFMPKDQVDEYLNREKVIENSVKVIPQYVDNDLEEIVEEGVNSLNELVEADARKEEIENNSKGMFSNIRHKIYEHVKDGYYLGKGLFYLSTGSISFGTGLAVGSFAMPTALRKFMSADDSSKNSSNYLRASYAFGTITPFATAVGLYILSFGIVFLPVIVEAQRSEEFRSLLYTCLTTNSISGLYEGCRVLCRSVKEAENVKVKAPVQ